jgi:predicted RecA/RadA family phage recombinase
MSVKYIQTGDAVDYTPGANVSAGDVVVQGDLVGVAKLDIQTGKLGALALAGLFDFPKATGESTAIATGARCYWDAAEGVAKGDAEAGANKLVGKAVKAAGDADATVRIALCSGDAVTVTADQAAAVADAGAATATAAPAGGTGAAAGAWDTAAHRDAAIATINALVADTVALRAKINALLASLRTAGLLAE